MSLCGVQKRQWFLAVVVCITSLAFCTPIHNPNSKQHDSATDDVCDIKVLVDDHKKLGDFVLKQVESELNRIFAESRANIHATFATSGSAPYALRIRDVAPKNNGAEENVLGQTSINDPHNSFLFIETIENQWRRLGTLPRGGRGVVYGRVYAHELAAHGILGWKHSRPGDQEMGFLGSGRNWGAFLFNNDDDSKFEFPPASAKLLNIRCRSTQPTQAASFALAGP